MKEALDLWRVQIHSDHVADADDLQKVSHHPRHFWLALAIAFVGPPVTRSTAGRT
jgi:hypothetical protein